MLSGSEASKRAPNHTPAKPLTPRLIPPRAGEAPFLIPPHAGERKGAVMLSTAKHLNSRPTKSPRGYQTPRLSNPAALQSGASLDSSLRLE
jgi:hypothetical protein